MDKTIAHESPLSLARRFIQVNGLYLSVAEAGRRAAIILRRWVLAGELGCPGLSLGANCHLRGLAYIRIGNNFYAGDGLWLEALDRYRGQNHTPRIAIGDNVSISRWSHISSIDLVKIGAHVLIGSNVMITDHNHGSYIGNSQTSPAIPPALRLLGGGGPVIIGENVWIGDNVTIIGPVSIGDGVVVAANTVVTRDIAPNTIVGGIPCRPLKRYNPSTMSWEKS
jgi:lipopolysaccharide O-acetyltransferase